MFLCILINIINFSQTSILNHFNFAGLNLHENNMAFKVVNHPHPLLQSLGQICLKASNVWRNPVNLRIPGPIPVPDDILKEMSGPMINHRGTEYKELLVNATDRLKRIFETQGDV